MRQALNNLQSTAQGFNHVSAANVFKVKRTMWFLLYVLRLFLPTPILQAKRFILVSLENGEGDLKGIMRW